MGINDAEEIVGYYADSAGIRHGFLLKGKTYTTLDVPGAALTMATGINNKGRIILFWLDSKGAIEASVYNGKTCKTINVPGRSRLGCLRPVNDSPSKGSELPGVNERSRRGSQWTSLHGEPCPSRKTKSPARPFNETRASRTFPHDYLRNQLQRRNYLLAKPPAVSAPSIV